MPNNPEKDWTILTTVDEDIEFGMIEGLLKLASIPVIRNVQGIDGLMHIVLGRPIKGIDILVPKERYDEALALLNSSVDEEDFEEEQREIEDKKNKA